MTAADLTPDNLAILEAKLRADLEMVLKVRAVLEEHLGGQSSPILALPAPTSPPAASAPAPLRGPVSLDRMPPPPLVTKEVKTEVRAVVEALSGPFKIGAVKTALKKNYVSFPDTSVRSVLTRMVQAGELKLVQRGFGRGGSTFQKVGHEAEGAVDSDDSASA